LERDLASVELWEESLRRSRRRRDREAAQPPFELPGRRLALTGLVALAGVPAAAVVSGEADGFGIGGTAHAATAHADDVTAGAAARVASRGRDVARLQRKLGVAADGVFGPQTERALKRWQRRHGLVADGIAGPVTRRAMGLGAGPVLKRKRTSAGRRRGGHRRHAAHSRPSRGGGVRALQRAIGVHADGVFGPATERALKRWQRRHGLVADGIAGPQTRAKMGLGSGPVLKRKRSGRRDSSTRGGSYRLAGVIAAANRIATKPYKYGGGHGSFTDSGYDCSGSVSYALHGGGLLTSPLDSSGFMSYGAPGRGRHITIYANRNHVYMTIDGRRFDTSARFETGSRWTSTWRSPSGYVVRHPPGL
jgi:peptidoglycan hydrolase-like protein with peptidoglycan-binding domain